MTDSPIRRLIDRSSLGTPDARTLRDSVPDETARRTVARAEQLAAEHIPYYCPASRSTECCPECSGWDVCCDRPDLHRRLHDVDTGAILARISAAIDRHESAAADAADDLYDRHLQELKGQQ